MILVDVHAALILTLESDARAADLRQPVNVISADAELLLDVPAHFLRPCLCAEDAGLQLDPIPQAALADRLSQIGRIRRRAAQDG